MDELEKLKKELFVDSLEYEGKKLAQILSRLLKFARIGSGGQVFLEGKSFTLENKIKVCLAARAIGNKLEPQKISQELTARDIAQFISSDESVVTSRLNDILNAGLTSRASRGVFASTLYQTEKMLDDIEQGRSCRSTIKKKEISASRVENEMDATSLLSDDALPTTSDGGLAKREQYRISKKFGPKKVEIEPFEVKGDTTKKIPSLIQFAEQRKLDKTTPAPEVIVNVGYYITYYLQQEEFSEGNTEFACKALSLDRPLYLHQAFTDTKNKKNWIEPGSTSDRWKVSRLGEIYMEKEEKPDEKGE